MVLTPLIAGAGRDFENRDPLKGDGNDARGQRAGARLASTLKTETRLKGMETKLPFQLGVHYVHEL